MRRGNNAESPYHTVDRENGQGYETRLAQEPYETERTRVLGMIHGSGMAVHRHREGKEQQTAQKPDGSKPA